LTASQPVRFAAPVATSKKKKPSAKSSKKPARKVSASRTLLLVGTRKGAFLLRSDGARKRWKIDGPHMFGSMVHHLVLDPRDGKTLLMAARTGHLGPTVFRSTDAGRTWTECKKPPAFRKVPEGKRGRVLDHVFWLTPSTRDEPGVWYAGSSPQGLFRTEDGGVTWAGVDGFNEHPMLPKWTMDEDGGGGGTPDGPKLHSVIVDPRNPRHLYIGMSAGGIYESHDRGLTWKSLNDGMATVFPVPEGEINYGHDPHCVVLHPAMPDRLYQQNHCGIYLLDRPAERWTRIGDNMPRKIGDIGFPMVVHPRDPDTAWVFPMDGTDVWPRTSVDGKPAAYVTRDAGKTWSRQDGGLPREHGWFTVKRQAADEGAPVGLYFGTTGGSVWASSNEGKKWECIAEHLPHVYSVAAVTL